MTELEMQNIFVDKLKNESILEIIGEDISVADSCPDILARHSLQNKIIVFELKLRDWKKAIQQCNKAKWYSHAQFIVMPEHKRSSTIERIKTECIKNEIGYVIMTKENYFITLVQPTYELTNSRERVILLSGGRDWIKDTDYQNTKEKNNEKYIKL